MKDKNKEIGDALRYYRTMRNWSLQYVADELGTHKSTISYWETGRSAISAVDLMAYLKLLGVHSSEFIERVFQ